MSAYTIEQYNALTEAIAMGAHKVKYQDKEVEYRGLKDMLALQERMEKSLGLNTGTGVKRTVAVYSSGL